MKKNLYLLIVCLAVFACDKDNDVTPPTKTQLLTDGSRKGWNIHSTSDDDLCPTSVDNTYFFSADGKFEFDRGTNVETQDCSDIINVVGTWSFKENETKLIVLAEGPTAGPAFDEPFQLMDVTITSLTESELVVTNNTEVAVLRKK